MKKFRRIEKLLYFREWAIALYYKTHNQEYMRMMIDTWKELYKLGVIVADVGIENPHGFIAQIEKILGLAEIIQEKRIIKSMLKPPECPILHIYPSQKDE